MTLAVAWATMKAPARLRALAVAALSLSFVLAFGACSGSGSTTKRPMGTGPASTEPGSTGPRTLSMDTDPAGSGTTKDFAVVFASPKKETVHPSEISIVWNRPMRALELAGQESEAPAKVTTSAGAPVEGSWRWMGTSAVIFAPKHALPRATEYVVTVPKGTRALDNSVLAEDYTFSFSTPPPRLDSLYASDGNEHLKPKSFFSLRFTQPVDLAEVERATYLRLGTSAERLHVHAAWEKPNVKTLVKVTPLAALPLNTPVEVVVDSSFHGTEGPLPMGTDRNLALSTYGPLSVVKNDCSRSTPNKKCDAAHPSLYVELSNEVTCKEWQGHVRLTPAPVTPIKWDCNNYPATVMYVPATLLPARSYTLTVTAGLRDAYGQALAKGSTFTIETDDRWPSVDIGLEGSVFEAGKAGDVAPEHVPGPRLVPIAAINTDQYDLLAAGADESQVAQYLSSTTKKFEEVVDLLKAKVEQVKPPATQNLGSVNSVALQPLLGKSGRGAAFLGVRSGDHRPWRADSDVRLVAVTDLAISARMSRFGSLVWVTHLSDGAPVAGATVAVRDQTGKQVFETKADDDGLAIVPATKFNPIAPNGDVDQGPVVFARAPDGLDWTYKQVSDRATEPGWGDVAGRLPPIGMLFTDSGVYRPGETVRVKGLFRQPRAKGTVTPHGNDVNVSASDGAGEKIFEETVKLDAFGGFSVDVPVPTTAHLGLGGHRREGRVRTRTTHPTGSASASFMLAHYKPTEVKVSVDPSKTSYMRGDKATFESHGDYLFGAPMSSGKVHFTATRGQSGFRPPGAEGPRRRRHFVHVRTCPPRAWARASSRAATARSARKGTTPRRSRLRDGRASAAPRW